MSRASTQSRVSAHVVHFKGSIQQLLYKRISRVSAHADQNRKLCSSAHGRLPGTLRYMQDKNTCIWELELKVQGGGLMREGGGYNCGILQYSIFALGCIGTTAETTKAKA